MATAKSFKQCATRSRDSSACAIWLNQISSQSQIGRSLEWIYSFYFVFLEDMRPYTNFRNKRVGKRVDYDGAFGFQCVDLAKQYIGEALGFGKVWALWNAKAMPNNPFFANWEKIKGTKNLMQGDIIIRSQGKYGHVAIVDHIRDGKVYVLEQNGSGKNSGSGLGENAIRIKGYPLARYDVVLRCQKIFDNLQAERKFVAEKIARLKAQGGQESEIRMTEGYLRTTRYLA